jgi:hypothetical protein
MLERNGDFGKLTTVERFDPTHSLAKERLHVAAPMHTIRLLSANDERLKQGC